MRLTVASTRLKDQRECRHRVYAPEAVNVTPCSSATTVRDMVLLEQWLPVEKRGRGRLKSLSFKRNRAVSQGAEGLGVLE